MGRAGGSSQTGQRPHHHGTPTILVIDTTHLTGHTVQTARPSVPLPVHSLSLHPQLFLKDSFFFAIPFFSVSFACLALLAASFIISEELLCLFWEFALFFFLKRRRRRTRLSYFRLLDPARCLWLRLDRRRRRRDDETGAGGAGYVIKSSNWLKYRARPSHSPLGPSPLASSVDGRPMGQIRFSGFSALFSFFHFPLTEGGSSYEIWANGAPWRGRDLLEV